MYSLMSKRIIDSSLPKKYAANAFVSSVLPTPVGPEKIKLAIGRFGFFKPTRALRIAFETALTASSCPIKRWWRVSSIFNNLTDSVSVSFCTGTPVHDATI